MRPAGKFAIISGAASGMGVGTARMFGERPLRALTQVAMVQQISLDSHPDGLWSGRSCWRKPDSNRRSQAAVSSGASGHAPPGCATPTFIVSQRVWIAIGID
jgi:hypothetical protein